MRSHVSLLFYQDGAQLLLDKLSQVEGLSPLLPQASIFIMVGIEVSKFRDIEDDLDFTTKLLAEKSVFVVPGQVRGTVSTSFKLYSNYTHVSTHAHKQTCIQAYTLSFSSVHYTYVCTYVHYGC